MHRCNRKRGNNQSTKKGKIMNEFIFIFWILVTGADGTLEKRMVESGPNSHLEICQRQRIMFLTEELYKPTKSGQLIAYTDCVKKVFADHK